MKSVISGLAAACCVIPCQSWAAGQESSPEIAPVVQEVIVTARRRDESLQSLPMSVVVASDVVLQSANVDAVNELYRIVPNLTLTEETGSAQSALILRGIGTFSLNTAAVDPSIATVVDGVVSGTTGGGGVADFADVARVEVLRGPQGTLFGKNSSAGLIQIITKEPTEEFTGNFGLSYATYDEVAVNGAVSGPLVGEELLGRLAFMSSKRDGYIENIYDGRMLGDDNQTSWRGKLLFRPRATTKLKLSASMLDRHQDDSIRTGLARHVNALSPAREQLYLGGIASERNDEYNGIGRTNYRDKVDNVALQWDETLGEFALTSISAYSAWKWRYNPFGQVGLNTTPVTPAVTQLDQSRYDQKQISQEIRLTSPTGGRIDYVVGLFYFDQSFVRALNQRTDQTAAGSSIRTFNSTVADTDTRSFAAFGEANLHVTDTVTFIAGARRTEDEKQLHIVTQAPPPGYIGTLSSANPGITDDEVSVSNWSWRLGARWEPSADNTLYATASTGYKGPAFNVNSSLVGVNPRVRPETSISYEAGWKTRLLDQRLRMSLAVFHAQIDDFQTEGVTAVVLPNGELINSILLTNAGRLETQGVELELTAVPFDMLDVGVNAAYTDAQYIDYPRAACYPLQTVAQGCIGGSQDLSGTVLPRVPQWTFNMNVQRRFALPGVSFDGYVRAEYSWRDETQWGSAPGTIEDAYGQIGASLGVQHRDGRYSLSAFVENLTTEFHTSGISGGNATLTHFLPADYQRVVGVRFNYVFD